MNSFLTGIIFTFSTLALIGSSFSVYQISKLQSSLEMQADDIKALSQRDLGNQDTSVNPPASSTADNQTTANIAQEQEVESIPPQTKTASENIVAIEPGQFVNLGFDNKLKVEIESTKRIQNPDTGDQDIVVVNFRMLSLVPKMKRTRLSWSNVRGRNPDTSEEYRTEKRSDATYLDELPNNAWANAYVWLQVPQGVETIDVSVPETAMFRNVPIEE